MKAIFFTDPHRGYDNNTSRIHDKVFASLDQSLFDIVVVSGDWGIVTLDNVRKSFRAFRVAFPTKKIVGVLGNHDYWDKETKSMSAKVEQIKKFAQESDIHLLENNPYEIDNIVFLGFNGWYHHPHPSTRDSDYMSQYVDGQTVDNYLRNLADKAVTNMMDYPKENKVIVSVTHFPCIEEAMDVPEWNGNPRHGEVLLEFSDLIAFGHTHQPYDQVIDGVRVLNVGSDRSKPHEGYNQLVYKIIDLKQII